MQDYAKITPLELGKDSPIKLEVCETEQDLYWKIALEVFDLVKANNEKKEPTVMIVPYGPLGPWSRFVHLVNRYRVSLKDCWFINMDEYLAPDGGYLPPDHPLSFIGGMNRIFYGRVDEELNVLPENRVFPAPGKEDEILRLIEAYGKLDMVWGGVGINGHYAFNEPPEPGETVSNEEFLNRATRVLAVSRETITVNSVMNCGGNLDAIPKTCITVGMKEMFMAKAVCMLMPRGWNAGALRKVLHGGITAQVPCSLFQEHGDAKLYAAEEALRPPVAEIRVYNK